MTKDPYALCPCGAGVKQKWCTAKAGMEQADRAIGMIQNNQQEASLALLNKLLADRSQSECFRAYVATTIAQALATFDRVDEGRKAAENAVKEFPNSGVAHETLGDFPYSNHEYAEALDEYYEALANYPVTAVGHACRTLLKVGACHNFQGRPLAAWAAWRSSLKLDPEYKAAQDAIDEYIHNNGLLPNDARVGLSLRRTDEFTLFNEEIGERWEQAIADGEQLHIDDLVMAFEDLTVKTPSDASAWYNLGVARAWTGENLRAIEALRKYVDLESDFDTAAAAWDLAEILRMGVGAEQESDCLAHAAVYRVLDPDAMLAAFKGSKRILIAVTPDERHSLHWMDKEVAPDTGPNVPILGGPPRQVAQIQIVGPFLEVVTTSREDFQETVPQFEALVGQSVRREDTEVRPADPYLLDAEPFQTYFGPGISDDEREKRELESTRNYYEQKWIHRPLRSLGGVAPIDAAQGPSTRKMLEGVIRFRERNIARRGVAYNFDRLRNKLGLPISGAGLGDHDDPSKPSQDVDLAAYSAPQLAALDPAKLSDDDLVAAYRAAIHLDASSTATIFARELTTRDSVATKFDILAVFRRLIQDRIQSRKTDGLAELIANARDYSARHYQGRDAALFDLFDARGVLLDGPRDEAVSRLRSIIERHPDRLDVAASAVESLLSVGEYASAKSVAEQGLGLAEAQRNADLQSQFREYAKAATARV